MSLDVFPETILAIAPAGLPTQVQYNNAGALAGSSGLTLNGTQVMSITYTDQAAGRTALGLGTMSVQNATAVAITGGTAVLADLEVDTPTLAVDTVNHRVGIGTLSPGSKLHVIGGSTKLESTVEITSSLTCSGTAPSYFGGTVQVGDNVGINTNPNAQARLDIVWAKATQQGIRLRPTGADDTPAGATLLFLNSASGVVGMISQTSTTTTYGTTSDVRLKHAITPLTGALARLQALRPVSFRWNQDDSSGVGFLAHELQVHIPEAVTGEPDALNEDGSIRPQGVDHSRLVPWLTAALQEAVGQIQDFAARLDALESALGL